MARTDSIYSASFTAASMMFNEMNTVVRMLLEDDSTETRKKLKNDPSHLQILSISARDRVSTELSKRFRTVDRTFWEKYILLSEGEQRLALFFVILKTYKLLFEFQVNVALPAFNSVDRTIALNDVLMALNDIACYDRFVDSWTDQTRSKVASTYITMLKQTGLVNEATGELQAPPVTDEAFVPYVLSGDLWFLQACFLPQYKVEQIKQLAL